MLTLSNVYKSTNYNCQQLFNENNKNITWVFRWMFLKKGEN